MLRTRVIPCLLLRHEALVKTIRFGKFNYIGDPANTCRIFNELEVDELTFLELESYAQCTLLNTKDMQEGVAARMQKRKPEFKGE